MDEQKNTSGKVCYIALSVVVTVCVTLIVVIVYVVMQKTSDETGIKNKTMSLVKTSELILEDQTELVPEVETANQEEGEETPKQLISDEILNKEVVSFSDLEFPVSQDVNRFESSSLIPLKFSLPKGYGVFHGEGFEGAYTGNFYIGKEIEQGYLFHTGTGIHFSESLYGYGILDDKITEKDANENPELIINYIGESFNRSGFENFSFIELFENKAIVFSDESRTVIGYLREDQLPDNVPGPMFIIVGSSTYGSGVEGVPELFGTLVNSLRLNLE